MRNKINVIEYINKDKTDEKGRPDWIEENEVRPIYYVPIERLYYNDENGRIATFRMQYEQDNTADKLETLSLEEYNNLFHGFTERAHHKDLKKTEENIYRKGQINPGVILADGRIVSGNRRFTVLRNLYKKHATDKFRYFKCFILQDRNFDNLEDKKYIKEIERTTQYSQDEKVDYDPVERLVDIYRDLIHKDSLWTVEEYSKKFMIKKSELEKMISTVNVMIDYLEYIEKPEQFHFARQHKLDGPMREIEGVYKKLQVSNPDEWARIRPAFYETIGRKDGDKTRLVRDIKKIYTNGSESFEKLLNNVNERLEEQFASSLSVETANDSHVEAKRHIVSDNKIENTVTSSFNQDSLINQDNSVTKVKSSQDVIGLEEIYLAREDAKISAKRAKRKKDVMDSVEKLYNNLKDVIGDLDSKEKAILIKNVKDLRELLNSMEELNN